MVFDKSKGKKVATGEFWKPEKEGESIEGVLTDKWEGQYGWTASIRQDDGSVLLTPSNAFLQTLIKQVPVGDQVLITYQGVGIAKPGQDAPKLFEVQHYKE